VNERSGALVNEGSARARRLLDLGLLAATAPVWLPLMGGLSAASLVAQGRPVLFVQTRPGLHRKPFRLVKFRTMREAPDAHGRPLPDEVRLTRWGRLLRKTSLDELPEVFNVIAGEMSLVGPRPLLMDYLPLYSARQDRRHAVLPGITGLAQVKGRNRLRWEEKFELDVWYVENRSLALDLRILAETVAAVLRGRGIGHGEAATMPRFTGARPPGPAAAPAPGSDPAPVSGSGG
jgi:lipopolysaccharide/colanic/teichoic acid biosynthesis glycosyltransferase